MERMLCAECAAVSYSAAATMLVERGERCPRCGGRLSVEPNEPVAAAPPGDAARRRFTA
jgi:DNA-directed RNA polymerase subunit RPC12/RpoP